MIKYEIMTALGGAVSVHDYAKLQKGKNYAQKNFRFMDEHNIESFIDKTAERCVELHILVRNVHTFRSHILTSFLQITVKDVYDQNPDKRLCPLSSDLEKLLLSQNSADCTFNVRQRTFPAHKSIVSGKQISISVLRKIYLFFFSTARSSYLKNLLASCKGTVDIRDMSPEVFTDILNFIYTDEIKNSKTTAASLLAAAHKFKLVDLERICEDIILQELMAGSDAGTVFNTAHKYNCSMKLKKAAFTMIQE